MPEERLGHGAVPRLRLSVKRRPHPLRHRRRAWRRAGVIDSGAASRIVGRVSEAFDVRKGSPDPEAQRAVRRQPPEIRGRPRDRPQARPSWSSASRPGASMPVPRPPSGRRWSTSRAPARRSLMISQDLDEILEISDRIAVISHGRLSAPRPRARPAARGDRPDDGRRRRDVRRGGRAMRIELIRRPERSAGDGAAVAADRRGADAARRRDHLRGERHRPATGPLRLLSSSR